jgi:hypothetical protein
MSMKNTHLTEDELKERIEIVKRFKSLLEQQRAKFQEYLAVLEKQHEKIEIDDAESMSAHAELENQIVANIKSLQKVIEPMNSLYQSVSDGEDTGCIDKIQSDLDKLQRQVLVQNEKNRELLKARMNQLKSQMTVLAVSNPYRGKRSIYAERQAGNLVSIEG